VANLQLSIAVTNNDRTRPIADGSVKPEGIDWTVTTVHASEMFWRQLTFAEFDVSEMSMSSLLIYLSRGGTEWVAIPVFTSRSFFHTGALVRTDRGIEKPEDLKGKRVGVPEYQQTAALWSRGVLQHEFGVTPQDIHWYMERTEMMSHGGPTGFKPPDGVTLDRIPAEKSIGSMMLSGELDATLLYLTATNLVDRSTANLDESTVVRPLFPDPVAESSRYFQKTGFYHINHGVVIRRSILEKYPWVALNVFNAFHEAHDRVYNRTRELADVYFRMGLLPRESRQALATDPYPYGVTANRRILETITEYSNEQGLTPRKLALEEVFAPSTLEL
jgi:4,5-dihydroxyphthalate decarboxylase